MDNFLLNEYKSKLSTIVSSISPDSVPVPAISQRPTITHSEENPQTTQGYLNTSSLKTIGITVQGDRRQECRANTIMEDPV